MISARGSSIERKMRIIIVSVLIICAISICTPVAGASVVSEGRSGSAVGEIFVYGREGFRSEYVKITVDMNSQPVDGKGNYNESYDGKVKTESSLYNSSSVDSTVKLYFSEGAAGYGYLSKERKVYLGDELLPLQKAYVIGYRNMPVSDKYIEAVTGVSSPDDVISPDEKVYVYEYSVSVSDEEETILFLTGYEGDFPLIAKGADAFNFRKDDVLTKLYMVDIEDKSILTVASVGNPIDVSDWKAAKNSGDAVDGKYYDCKITERSRTVIPYKEYVRESLYCPDEGKDDLYACVTAALDGAGFVDADDIFASRSHTCIEIVDVTVAAGEREVLTVEENFFPGVMKNYSPPVYVLETEVPFFNIATSDFYAELTINTPLYVTDSYEKLTKTGSSYTLRTDKSSLKNLTVKLCASEDPESLPDDAQSAFLTLLYLMHASPVVAGIVIAVVIIVAIVVAVGIVTLVRFLIKLHKKQTEI